jgi:hypothetical protein
MKLANEKDNVISAKLAFIFILLFIVLSLHEKLLTATFALLVIYAGSSNENAIKSLALAAVIKYLNPAIYAFPAELGVLGWAVFATATTRLFFTSLNKISNSIPLLLFSLSTAILSVFISKHLAISLLKLVGFTLGAASIIQGASSLNIEQHIRIKKWLFNLIIAVVILSMPTLLYQNIAYNRNGVGFQGILNHPQTFGPILVPLAMWFLTAFFFKKNEKVFFNLAISILLISLMMISQARTSIATVLLSLTTLFFIQLFTKGNIKNYSFSKSIKTIVASFFGLGLAVVSVPAIQNSIYNFIFKRSSSNIDQALSSRAGGISSQWKYFLDSPLAGNGFGVYAWGGVPEGVTFFMGIPISAPVEKGFLPTAILEEVGIIGTFFFIYFLYRLFKLASSSNDLRLIGIFLSSVYINIGEMVFFSVGGLGIFYWTLIGLAISGKKKN